MRTAKYNDYTFLRILLFIILIVLAIFACKHFVKAPCEHINTSVVIKDATCTEEGYSYKQCNDCGEKIDNKVLEATGHLNTKDVVVDEPTCSKTGRAYTECSVCKEKVEDFISIPTIAHTPGDEIIVEATCTKTGTSHVECTVCNQIVGDVTTIPVVAHTPGDAIIVEATCTQTGTSHVECTVCNQIIGEVITLPVVAHTPGEPVVKNEKHTLTEGASYEEFVYCTECDEQISMKMVNVEHNVETTVVTTDPTCVEKGTIVTTIYCKDCDKTLSTDTKDIAPLGHDFAWAIIFENDNHYVIGQCTTPDCGYEFDPKVDTTYQVSEVTRNEETSVIPGCGGGFDIYEATISKDNTVIAKVTSKLYLPADSSVAHKLYVRLKDADGNWVVMNPENYADYKLNDEGYVVDENGELIDFLQYIVKDENGAYFNASTPGFIKVSNSEWDENGFAVGAFKCSNDVVKELEHWVTVRIYNDLA